MAVYGFPVYDWRRAVVVLVWGIPCSWVGERIGIQEFGPCCTMGIVEDDVIQVGLVWCDYRPDMSSISMCLAIDDFRHITKGIMAEVFAYPFEELQVRRVTNTCSIHNKKAIAINRRAGLIQEGIMRQAYPDGSDMVVFGMLKAECKYLKPTR